MRESNGEECDMTLKNNIEGIIIKWAYQIEEVRIRVGIEVGPGGGENQDPIL